MANNSLVLNRINELEVKQLSYQKETDDKFEQVFHYISEHEEVSQKIFFEGQIYDAFSLLTELIVKTDFTGCAEMRIYVIISKNPREWADIK